MIYDVGMLALSKPKNGENNYEYSGICISWRQ